MTIEEATIRAQVLLCYHVIDGSRVSHYKTMRERIKEHKDTGWNDLATEILIEGLKTTVTITIDLNEKDN